MRGWYGDEPPDAATVREWCAKARAHAEEKDRQNPNFWNSIVIPESTLILALAEKELPRQKELIIDEYCLAKARGASPREFGSVTEHLEFLAEMMAGAQKPEEIKEQAAALQDIVAHLAHLAEGGNGG